jgi:hypothetical protein
MYFALMVQSTIELVGRAEVSIAVLSTLKHKKPPGLVLRNELLWLECAKKDGLRVLTQAS